MGGRGGAWYGHVFSPLGGVITWQRVIECLFAVCNCVIYILPLLSSYSYDDIVLLCCDKQHFTCKICFWWPIGGGPVH